jgi:hypothetical protein
MITGVSLSQTKDYISKFDKGEPKTVWKIGTLDSDIFDLLGEYTHNSFKMMSEAIRFGLKGFENFKDSLGNPVAFNTVSRAVGSYNYQVVIDNIMKIIPQEVKIELGNEILTLTKLSSEETKN